VGHVSQLSHSLWKRHIVTVLQSSYDITFETRPDGSHCYPLGHELTCETRPKFQTVQQKRIFSAHHDSSVSHEQGNER
jgi:hypothetical protein